MSLTRYNSFGVRFNSDYKLFDFLKLIKECNVDDDLFRSNNCEDRLCKIDPNVIVSYFDVWANSPEDTFDENKTYNMEIKLNLNDDNLSDYFHIATKIGEFTNLLTFVLTVLNKNTGTDRNI